MKRGQVTIFIILAIVILIVVALVSYYFGDLEISSKDVNLPQDVLRFKEHRDACVETSGAVSLFLLGLRSGYYNVPESSLDLEGVKIAYLVDDGENKLLDLDKIKDNYYLIFNSKLRDCIEYPRGFETLKNDYDVKINFLDDTNLIVDYKMKIKKGENEYDLSERLTYTYDIDFNEVYDMVGGLIQSEIENPYIQDLTFIAESSMEVSVVNSQESAVYIITDPNSKYEGVEYMFVFGVRR